ncbi:MULTISPECIES: peptidoglycan-binding domain-containing protein [unclassified Microbacterium]|uniref:peptidoglycan-binding domain-containing protein n=1 Tax=unclassified Microbacterium TaxID=2609290 RepID=UPI0009DCEC61|nr:MULTISPECIES: peptidoglycan-binding domain-containing protein [unclassified Microbacterium]
MDEVGVPETARRSRWIVVIAVVLIVALIGAGFWFAAQFQSSAQQEANAKAPAPGPVFAEVTQGALAGEVGFTGQAGPSTQTPVTVLPVAEASLTVVTGRPLATGATASSGQVLTEVNGRPLFGVQSAFSFYRDMGVGDRGPDVEALQAALVVRSYQLNADGRFGGETAAAVKRWYQDNGYEAPTRSAAAEKTSSEGGEKAADPSEKAPAAEGYVPVAEILAMPSASAQVVKGVQVGQRLAAEGVPDLILGSADLVVTITVPVTDLGDVVAGDAAVISIGGTEVEGIVGDIRPSDSAEDSEGSGSNGDAEQAAPEVTFAVVPKTALPGSSGRARVAVIKQIVAEDALIVPVLAVSDRGPDKNVLTKQQADGTLLEVPVTVLGTLQGEVAVEPRDEGALKAGELVRVG